MTPGSAPARAIAPFLPRVLGVDEGTGSSAVRRDVAPRDDARIVFAATFPDRRDDELPRFELEDLAAAPPDGDPRWSQGAFVAPASRPRDRRLVLRSGTLRRAAERPDAQLALAL